MPDISPSRRQFIRLGSIGAAAATSLRSDAVAAEDGGASPPRPFLTPASEFEDVSRGKPVPHSLTGDALAAARLTPETWRLEITAEETTTDLVKEAASLGKTFTLEKGNAIDYPTLLELGRTHRVAFLKAMQCLNIATPLGQGLWEGVPLRELLRLCGPIHNVRRIYYDGFHNDDPKQLFRSSLSYSQVMETAPGDLPVFVAYRLNGETLSLERGGPVRMVVPWAHGFKSIKWLHRIVLRNHYQTNDTYAEKNNDPESPLKTAAYLDEIPGPVPVGQSVSVGGLAIAGLSGLESVEIWWRSAEGQEAVLADDDPAWESARWERADLEREPADWNTILPAGMASRDILGFDPASGRTSTDSAASAASPAPAPRCACPDP